MLKGRQRASWIRAQITEKDTDHFRGLNLERARITPSHTIKMQWTLDKPSRFYTATCFVLREAIKKMKEVIVLTEEKNINE